jgi:hypothetical protein
MWPREAMIAEERGDGERQATVAEHIQIYIMDTVAM